MPARADLGEYGGVAGSYGALVPVLERLELGAEFQAGSGLLLFDQGPQPLYLRVGQYGADRGLRLAPGPPAGVPGDCRTDAFLPVGVRGAHVVPS
ncbi:hypothetical protein ABZX72_34435 [Streptomyces cyaneofuscatus]|uniref:hypothetical protein n=1 Tax=Streptomyces cyaneofuscatus TaxID=66883 RepID=UPI0033A96A29